MRPTTHQIAYNSCMGARHGSTVPTPPRTRRGVVRRWRRWRRHRVWSRGDRARRGNAGGVEGGQRGGTGGSGRRGGHGPEVTDGRRADGRQAPRVRHAHLPGRQDDAGVEGRAGCTVSLGRLLPARSALSQGRLVEREAAEARRHGVGARHRLRRPADVGAHAAPDAGAAGAIGEGGQDLRRGSHLGRARPRRRG
jgi:hypothetical protein